MPRQERNCSLHQLVLANMGDVCRAKCHEGDAFYTVRAFTTNTIIHTLQKMMLPEKTIGDEIADALEGFLTNKDMHFDDFQRSEIKDLIVDFRK